MPSISLRFAPAFRLGGVLLLAGLLAAAAARYPDAPPPAHTGGFGEPTCLDCHFDAPLNEAAGLVRVDGLPERYRPGAAYDLTVRLRHPETARWGFQLAARFLDTDRAGRQGGAFAALGSGVTVDLHDGVEYVRHAVAASAADSAHWTFRWRAPEGTSAAVAFHLAALAGNDDESPFGDLVYTWTGTASGR